MSIVSNIRFATLSLVLAAVWSLPAQAAPFFTENFGGTSLDPTVWSASTNGYTAPAISVSGGLVQMGQAGTSSTDFPYVISLGSIFPSSGDFSIAIDFQYTGLGPNGSGLQILDSTNRTVAFFWPGSGSALTYGTDVSSFTSGSGAHTLEFLYVGGNVTTVFDTVVQGTSAAGSRPDRVWFGHPTEGQVNSTQVITIFPGLVGPTGIVTGRWWNPNIWTTFNIDSFRVSTLGGTTQVPEPGSLALFGFGLLSFGAFRRRRRAG